MLKGFTFTGVSFRSGDISVEAARVFVKPDLSSTLRGRPALAELVITSPSVILVAGAGAAEAPAGLPPGLPEIFSGAVTDGSLRLPGGLPPAERIDCRFTFSHGLFSARSCSVLASGASAELSGTWDGSTAAARGRVLYAPEDLSADFDYSFGERHTLSAAGRWGAALFALKGGAGKDGWKFELAAKGRLPLERLNPGLRELRLRSARLSASGAGLSPAEASGKGKFAAESGGAAAAGTFSFGGGTYEGTVNLSSGPLAATVSARLESEKLSGGWELRADEEFPLTEAGAISFTGFRSSGTFSGDARAPVAKGSVMVLALRSTQASCADCALNFEFSAGGKKNFDFTFNAGEVSAGGETAGPFFVSAEGTPENHSFNARLTYRGSPFGISGTGSVSGETWSARADRASLPDFGWELCGPFSVRAAPDGTASLGGLCLLSGGSRLRLSAEVSGGALSTLQAGAENLELSWLEKAGFTELRPEGLVNAEATYAAGSGHFSVVAAGMKLNGLGMGEAAAAGRFRDGTLFLENGQWRLYGGSVLASGSARRAAEGLSAAFSLRASTANIAPLLAFFPGYEAGEAWFSGASSVTFTGGKLDTSGALYLALPRLTVPAYGLVLDNISAELSAGDLSSARLRAAAARKGGRLSAAGQISAAGPELKIDAADLPFSHPSGLSGKASGRVLLSGGWNEPALAGALELKEGRFEMKAWEKYQPAEERSSFYEALGIDLRVKAEKNAWYRDGGTSVEIKGDLFLKKEPYQAPATLGAIEAVRGHYSYLGNTFTVDSGRITFSGESPTDPAIAVEASMAERGAPYKVYFSASGTVGTPKVTLSSDPAMEQRDIMSYLVTGRPLYELYTTGRNGDRAGRDDRTAQNLAAGYLSKQASSAVGSKLDLDVVNLKVTGDSQADITVGRYVMKDLFISYGQVLGPGGEKRVSAEYTVTRHLSLEGKNSSDGRYGADLLFKFGIR